MIEITEKTVAIWYIQLTPDSDFMGTLTETEPKTFELTYRFRYYNDDKVFDSKDVKNWYKLGIKDTSKEIVLGKVKCILSLLGVVSGAEGYYEYINDRGLDDLMERFMQAPFAHMKKENIH